MQVPYAELHCLSNFSFLRGASRAEDLVERVIEGLATFPEGFQISSAAKRPGREWRRRSMSAIRLRRHMSNLKDAT